MSFAATGRRTLFALDLLLTTFLMFAAALEHVAALPMFYDQRVEVRP